MNSVNGILFIEAVPVVLPGGGALGGALQAAVLQLLVFAVIVKLPR